MTAKIPILAAAAACVGFLPGADFPSAEVANGRIRANSGGHAARIPCDIRRGAMTLNVTVPDAAYRQMAELAARQQVSVERIAAAALTEQLTGWARVEQLAERAS